MRQHLLSQVKQLHGKQLGFNNLYDLNAARDICDEFTLPCVTIIKHNNPCGCALAENVAAAYDKAYACDPVSAFGSVIAVNRTVDVPLADRLTELFVEVLFAPSYEEEALSILTRKPDIRILQNDERRQDNPGELDYKRVLGGILVQDRDSDIEERDEMTVVTKRHPSEQEWGDLIFAFRIAKHVKSNAIVMAKNLATLGVGAGQMSRVDARASPSRRPGTISGRRRGIGRLLSVPGRGRPGHRERRHRVHATRRVEGRRDRGGRLRRETPPWSSPGGGTSCTERGPGRACPGTHARSHPRLAHEGPHADRGAPGAERRPAPAAGLRPDDSRPSSPVSTT